MDDTENALNLCPLLYLMQITLYEFPDINSDFVMEKYSHFSLG